MPQTWMGPFAMAGAGKVHAGFYPNTNLSEIPTARVREAYGGNYERLLTLKRKYDPTNLFRLNANIDPKGAAT